MLRLWNPIIEIRGDVLAVRNTASTGQRASGRRSVDQYDPIPLVTANRADCTGRRPTSIAERTTTVGSTHGCPTTSAPTTGDATAGGPAYIHPSGHNG